MMTTAFELYRMRGKYCDAVRVALRMDDSDLLAQLLAECDDKGMTQQMRSGGSRFGWPRFFLLTFSSFSRPLPVSLLVAHSSRVGGGACDGFVCFICSSSGGSSCQRLLSP